MIEDLDSALRYESLPCDVREALKRWIMASIKPADSICIYTSYSLKHCFEHSPNGCYIENGAFKGGMLAAGFMPIDEAALNWQFKVMLAGEKIGTKGRRSRTRGESRVSQETVLRPARRTGTDHSGEEVTESMEGVNQAKIDELKKRALAVTNSMAGTSGFAEAKLRNEYDNLTVQIRLLLNRPSLANLTEQARAVRDDLQQIQSDEAEARRVHDAKQAEVKAAGTYAPIPLREERIALWREFIQIGKTRAQTEKKLDNLAKRIQGLEQIIANDENTESKTAKWAERNQ